ncbi:MAG: hypothetical protein ACLSGB_09025 [Dorea sp.]
MIKDGGVKYEAKSMRKFVAVTLALTVAVTNIPGLQHLRQR